MLWVPTALSEREFWAEKIYGRPGDIDPYGLRPKRTEFWKEYGFNTEEELDAFLNQYAAKLKNFDWANALNKVKDHAQKVKPWSGAVMGEIIVPQAYRDDVKQRYEWEYQYYLGPIKFALKYDAKPFYYAHGACTRLSLFITLYDGTKIHAPSKGLTFPWQFSLYKWGSYVFNWDVPLKEILEIARLPNVISIEASDTEYPNQHLLWVGSNAWKNARQQIYTNYVKYSQSPPTPQPGTQPPGPSPSGTAGTSKAWTWIAIGGAAILLAILLTGRE
jgi:hypothetical protein